MPTDRKLVSKQEHEIRYLLRKWDINRKELLEIKGKKRSRKAIEKMIRAFKIDGPPYLMSCEYRKHSYKEVKPVFNQMLKSGLIQVVEKNAKNILFKLL